MGGGERFQDWEAYSHCKGRGGEAGERDGRLERQGRKGWVLGEARAWWRVAISARCIMVPFALGGKKGHVKQSGVQPLRPPEHLCLLGLSLLFAISLNNNQRQENHPRSSVSQEWGLALSVLWKSYHVKPEPRDADYSHLCSLFY